MGTYYIRKIKVENEKADGYQKYLDSKTDRIVSLSYWQKGEASVWLLGFLKPYISEVAFKKEFLKSLAYRTGYLETLFRIK